MASSVSVKHLVTFAEKLIIPASFRKHLMMQIRSAEHFLDVAEPVSLAFPGTQIADHSTGSTVCQSKGCLSFGLG